MNNFNLRKSLDFVFNAKLILFMFGILLLLPNIASAAANLPWSTTYNCADWTQSNGNVSCDGLGVGGGWTCDNGDGTVREDQITSAANYPGGSGKGQRHWLGDGTNNDSGGMSISFTSTQSEIWIRWYMRYENGFQWNPLNNQKILIVNNLAQNRTIIEYTWSDQTRISVSNYGGLYGSGTGNGWNTVMANGGTGANGNKTSDGQWHLYEVHIKTDTNGSNGIAEMWIDGVQRLSYSNVYFGSTGFDGILIGSNGFTPNNGRCMAVDFDDFIISTTGPIGGSIATSTPPVSDITSPSIPSNLSATSISTSQINLSWTASTDNIGVTGYRIYRCSGSGCVPSTQIATSATNSYSNTGLTANTTYVYRIAAYDAAGNVSAQSSSASAATQAVVDTTPPAAPTGLMVQ